MNFKYHLAIGIVGSIILKDWHFLIGSIIPDLPLLFNELNILLKKRKFSLSELNMAELRGYRVTHSLLIIPFLLFNYQFAIAITLHQISDWFTHTGEMSSMPFYPFQYKIKFGKEILK